jgi:hypothetical protein
MPQGFDPLGPSFTYNVKFYICFQHLSLAGEFEGLLHCGYFSMRHDPLMVQNMEKKLTLHDSELGVQYDHLVSVGS